MVICTASDSGIVAGDHPQKCGYLSSNETRPPELACDGLSLSSREKLIRVLVSWIGRDGMCHSRNADSLAFRWAGEPS